MIHKTLLVGTGLLFLTSGCAHFPSAGGGVQITRLEGKLSVQVAGKPFTEYRYENVPRPCLFPVLAPGGERLTRNWPMAEGENEEKDHPHHLSLWFGHLKVNGQDFWSIQPNAGKIVHDRFVEVKSGSRVGVIITENKWVAKDGTIVLRDQQTVRIYHRDQDRILDYEVTLRATEGDVTFGDDKDGLMAIRLAETMRLKPNSHNQGKPTGHIVMSTGVRDAQTWGKRAAWCDYHGPVGDKILGVAIFDHPTNPRHPTWWHVRDYGLFAANPFGIRHFENLQDRSAGDMKLPRGQSVTFKYRFYFHEGDEIQAQVARRYAEYVAEIP